MEVGLLEQNQGVTVTLYLIAGFTIALAVIGLARALRERPAERARGYPLGSYERTTLEGQK